MRNPKLFIHNTTLMVSARTEAGLPFLDSLYMNLILKGILARARELYEVKVCHFIFMANHLHMIIVVDNPEEVDDFMRYVKTESAHAVNRLWGRRKHTVWCEGYDSPILLTVPDVIREITYIYTNPLDKKYPESISAYKGVSSWRMFRGRKRHEDCRRIARSSIPKLESISPSKDEERKVYKELCKKSAGKVNFVLEADAWMECFSELDNVDPWEVNQDVLKQVIANEKKVLGSLQSSKEKPPRPSIELIRNYQPSKFSNRMICVCSDKELRIRFIGWYKELRERAKEAYKLIKRGVHANYPPGFFAPGGVLGVNMLPGAILA